MSDVFISYSRQNVDFARRLIERLNLSNKKTWIDWKGIPQAAPDWWEDIKAGIENADNFVFIMSPDSLASVVCHLELHYAIALGKRLIAVVLQEVEPRTAFASIANYTPDAVMRERLEGKNPLVIASHNWQNLSRTNWVFFRETDDFSAAFALLVKATETNLQYVKAHTRYLTRASEWERNNRSNDLLLFGGEVGRAEAWLAEAEAYAASQSPSASASADALPDALPKEIQREYIVASRQQANQRERNARRARTFAGVAGLTLLITIGLVIGGSIYLSVVAANVQQSERIIAANGLALRALDVEERDPPMGLRLAYEANLIGSSVQVERIFSELAYAPGIRRVFAGHEVAVTGVAFSPDGSTILSGAVDNTIILWDASSGSQLRRYTGHGDRVTRVVFAPDGARFASASQDNSVIIWDVSSGEIQHRLGGHRAPVGVQSVAFSPDGQAIASASCAALNERSLCVLGELIVWDVTTGNPLRQFVGHVGAIQSVDFSPDGQTLVSGGCGLGDGLNCTQGEVILWNAYTGEELRTLQGHQGTVRSVAFSPDGTRIISGSADGTVLLWNVTDGIQLQRYEGHTAAVEEVEFSPDGRRIASGSADGTTTLWDVASATLLRRYEGHDAPVSGLAFSPDGVDIASGARNGTLLLWSANEGNILHRYEGHTASVLSVAFSPDGTRIVSGSDYPENAVLLWDVSGGTSQRYDDHEDAVRSVAFAPDGRSIVSGSCGVLEEGYCVRGELLLWDADNGTLLRQLEGHDDAVQSVAFSPDGRSIVSGAADGTLLLWDATNGMLLREFAGHPDAVQGVAFSPDGSSVLSGSCGALQEDDQGAGTGYCIRGEMILWDVASGDVLRRYREGHRSTVQSVAFAPDGRTILSGACQTSEIPCPVGEMILWDVASGDVLRRFEGHENAVLSVAFAPDGRTILSGSRDGSVILWDITAGDILRHYDGHGGWVASVAYSPDGNSILSGSTDDTMLLCRYDDLEQLQYWTLQNRFLPELSCVQRTTYGLANSRCLDGTPPPTPTFVPTRTPLTPPTLPQYTSIASPTASQTPIPPTATLALSPQPDAFQLTATAIIEQATALSVPSNRLPPMATPGG